MQSRAALARRIGAAILIAASVTACGNQTAKSHRQVAPQVEAYELFRTPSSPVPTNLRPPERGVVRVLDTGNSRFKAVALLMRDTTGTEVCVLVQPGPTAPASHLSGACNGPSQTATQVPWLAAYADTQSKVSLIAGLVPDGISSLTLKVRDQRSLTLAVHDNSVAVRTSADITAFCWQNSGQTKCKPFQTALPSRPGPASG